MRIRAHLCLRAVAPVPAEAVAGAAPAELDGDGSSGQTGDRYLGDKTSRAGVYVGNEHLLSLLQVGVRQRRSPAVEQDLRRAPGTGV